MLDLFTNIDDLWMTTIENLFKFGSKISSRIGQTKESIGFQCGLTNIDQTFLLNKRRKLQPAYACAEVLWYLSQSNEIAMIEHYAPQYTNYAEDGIAHGAYGHRWATNTQEDQLNLLIEHLTNSHNSRQAIITMWKADDLWHSVKDKRKDLPCTLSMQFLIRQDKLHVVTTMRSNDVWLGLPYDIFAFTCVQRIVADILGIEPGSYVHQAGSMHLYEKNWKAAEEALDNTLYYVSEDYRRLTHGWSVPTQTRHIEQAVKLEESIREQTNNLIYEHTVSLPSMLYDLVACCANKWNKDVQPVSSILQEAIKNATAK